MIMHLNIARIYNQYWSIISSTTDWNCLFSILHNVTTCDTFRAFLIDCYWWWSFSQLYLFCHTLSYQTRLWKIGDEVFCICRQLKTIVLPKSGPPYIKNSVLCFGNKLEVIGKEAFSNCVALSGRIQLPDSVQHIDDCDFLFCHQLEHVTLPNSLRQINDYTFFNCKGLRTVDIPDSVISIGCQAFKVLFTPNIH